MTVQKFCVEGDPAGVMALAESQGWKITKPRWWQRSYAIKRWMVWLAASQIALDSVRGTYGLVRWLGG